MTQTYTGGCQCGKVRYEAMLELGEVLACNCSRCGRLGSLLAFLPKDSFKLLSGEGATTEYQFNKHVIHHLFCSICGIKSFARGVGRDGGATVAINTRCLDGIDVSRLNVMPYDGKNH